MAQGLEYKIQYMKIYMQLVVSCTAFASILFLNCCLIVSIYSHTALFGTVQGKKINKYFPLIFLVNTTQKNGGI